MSKQEHNMCTDTPQHCEYAVRYMFKMNFFVVLQWCTVAIPTFM